MRCSAAALAIGCAALVLPTQVGAAARDLRAERQRTVDTILTSGAPDVVNAIRATCVAGRQPASVANGRQAGLHELPDAVEYCVAALTRLGRSGTLGWVKDTTRATPSTAQTFDNGFVSAYRKRDPIPASLPQMAALKPTAERCLAMRETDSSLCFSVGYAFGARAAQGELIRVP